MPQIFEIKKEIRIEAPILKVWEAITDPAIIEKWFSPGTPWVLTELAVGGRLFVRHPESGAELYVSVLEEIDPPHRVVWHGAENLPNHPENRTTYLLSEDGTGTHLTMLYTGYGNEMTEAFQKMVDQSDPAFDTMLGNIAAVIEGRPLPNPSGF